MEYTISGVEKVTYSRRLLLSWGIKETFKRPHCAT